MGADLVNPVGPALSVSDIHESECRMGCAWPEDYRQFLLRNNGGMPLRSRFTIVATGREDTVEMFYGVNPIEEKDWVIYQRESSRDLLPQCLLTIGHDPAKNYICLGIAGKYRNKVYLWDKSGEFIEKLADPWRWVHLVSNSFAEFLRTLH